MRHVLLAFLAWGVGCLMFPLMLSAEPVVNANGTPFAQSAQTPHRNSQLRQSDLSRLKLNDQQRQQALDMKEGYRKRVSDLRCKLRQKKLERQKEMQQTTPDKEKLQLLSQEIGQIHGQILVEDANSRSDFEKILTPQQLEEWKNLRNARVGQNPEGLPENAK